MSKNTARRDVLLQMQETSQKKWKESKVFEADAPKAGEAKPTKFFGNFPYPYMNGLLHLGHAFSLSKLEFASAYHRLKGENVLFPQGFHCTGMPIKACADKLKREISLYGCPPVYPADMDKPKEEVKEEVAAEPKKKAKGKKSKAAAKQGRGATQYEILQKSGIPEEDIPKFQESLHWLDYFPPLAKDDIELMGCGVDWRRSFITTDVNPYYDSFVRWQFWKLKELGKVIKDKRHAVYSPLDGQPCADHDRASGEGVGPQEYTLIKMRVLEFPGKLEALASKENVFMLAATLRPETMYGQTNAWVLPDGEYGAYEGLNGEVYIISKHSARNLSYQDKTPEFGKPNCILNVTGHDLMGVPVKSPLGEAYDRIYVLPLLTVSLSKGTGVVTSVPSDSPDDFMGLSDLKKKEKLREKFGIKDEHVLPFEVVPVLTIPEFGDEAAAPQVCAQLKIQSQNDKVKLEQAKKMTYLKGFTDGVMVVGKYSGQKVQDAKPLIKKDLLDSGDAIVYFEPEKQVMSRSGDECVVALTDQWYLIYGEDEWLAKTTSALEGLNNFKMPEVKNAFVHTLGWMRQWACSRSFGLGTLMPWDEQYLIESLSDSTIYMAYYTVAHLLQNGEMYGKDTSGIAPEEMTVEVWDYVFADGPVPETKISKETLETMKAEFEYWYPFDLRVSGKDLIQNHLTFCLYNHTAIFPEDKWPKGMRCNGHLLLNNDKMSKSTGNFKTLKEAIYEYSSDGMRFALADAGDGMEDANFVHDTANAAILRLTKEVDWMEEVLVTAPSTRSGDFTFADKVFKSAISLAASKAVEAYEDMLYRRALTCGFYELQAARDEYRYACGVEGMHADLARLFCEVQVKLLTPFCPHTCEHVWSNLLKKEGCVINSGLPELEDADMVIYQSGKFIEGLVTSLRSQIQKTQAPPKKKKNKGPVAKVKVVAVALTVAKEYTGWRRVALESLASMYKENGDSFPEDKVFTSTLLDALKTNEETSGLTQKDLKMLVLPFAKFMSFEANKMGVDILCTKSLIDEAGVLNENIKYLTRALKVDTITVKDSSEDPESGANAYPGNPGTKLESVTEDPVVKEVKELSLESK
jgi:leucyl-tRNA synthetase